MSNTLEVVSYNILNPFHAVMHKEPNGIEVTADNRIVSNWETRAPSILCNLNASNFHVACLQEVSAIQARHLAKSFSLIVPAYPKKDPDQKTFANAIAFKPQVMRLQDHFQLMADVGEEIRTAPATLGIFTHLPSQKVIAVTSLHLKGYDPNISDRQQLRLAKQSGYDQLRQQLAEAKRLTKRSGCSALVVAGDFNEDPESTAFPSRMKLMQEEGFVHDGCLAASEPAKNRKIDWIYAAGALLEKNPVIWPFPNASDHVPVACRLEL